MVLVLSPSALAHGVLEPKLLQNPRWELLVDELIGQLTDELRALHGDRIVTPTSQPKEFLVEFIREALGPRKEFLVDVQRKKLLKFISLTDS